MSVQINRITPILRIFDEAAASEFYVDFLGFTIDWQHRYSADAPIYLQISRDDCVIHLSGHHGDCCPGAAMRILVADIDRLHAQIDAKQYRYARPSIENTPWGSRDLTVKDPFANRLTFTNAIST